MGSRREIREGMSIRAELEYLRALHAHMETEHKLDQAGLAAALKVDPATVSRMFAGQPSRITVQAAEYLGFPPPFVTLRSPEELEWIDLGRRLRDADDETFRQVVAGARNSLRLAEATRRARDAEAEIDKTLTPRRRK